MKKSSPLTIDLYIVVLAVILFTLFRFCSPVFINETSFASFYTSVSKLVVLAIAVWYIFIHRKAGVPFLLIFLFFLIRFFVTLWYAPQNIMRVFMGAYPILGLICISEILLKANAIIFIKSFAGILKLLCAINALQSIFLPNLFYQKYILGGENQIVFAYILSVVLESARKRGKKIYYKLYLGILTISILCIFSAGNLLGWVVFLALLIYYRKPRKIKSITFLYGYCVSWFLVVIVRVQNAFSWLIVNILHKDLTLTNRTIIWDIAFEAIKEKPLFGYGVQNTVDLFYVYLLRPGKPTVNSWFSAHNQVVQTLYESGIVSIIPVILLLVIVFRRLDRNEKNSEYPIMVAGLIGLSVSMMVEAPGWDSLFILLTLAYYIREVAGAFNVVEGVR